MKSELERMVLKASRQWAWTVGYALYEQGCLVARPTEEQVEYVAWRMTDTVLRSSMGRDENEQTDFDSDKWQELYHAVFVGTPF